MKHKQLKVLAPFLLSILLCFNFAIRSSADNTLDSLKLAYNKASNDSDKVNILHEWVVDLITIGHYPQADSLQTVEYNLALHIKYKEGTAKAILDKGVVYYYLGDYPLALENLFNSLNLFEEAGDKDGKARSILYVGYVYMGQEDAKKAMAQFLESSKIFEELKDDDYDATAIINIGNVYSDILHDYNKAMGYYFRSMKLFSKAKDDDGVASALKDIGAMYSYQKDTSEAIEYLNKSLDMFKVLNDKDGISEAEISLGNIYLGQKKYTQALELAKNSNDIGKEIESFKDKKESEKLLSEVYSAMNDGHNALEHYKAYIAANDSLISQENTKKSVRAEMNFEFEKKQAITKAEQDKKNALEQVQERKQKLTIYFISGIVLLFLAIAIFVFRSYLQKQRDNKELDIRNQKIGAAYKVIEEKNREITDSINYAKRIQNAILPAETQLQKYLPDSFILYKPKDIVSGDFYFLAAHPQPFPVGREKNAQTQVLPTGEDLGGAGTLFIAAADCTGHGVPGAFMSMIGSEKLNDAVKQASDTSQILQLLNKGIKSSLHQSGNESTRDGMDIALASLSPSKGGKSDNEIPLSGGLRGAAILQFSGANRPLWIIRNGNTEIEEIKPDKRAIGGFTESEQGFAKHETVLKNGDVFYLFSDGYADQFGGEQGKKLSTRRFREILLSIRSKTMREQKSYLEGFIESWKADKEQLDDILVIGVRI